MDINTAKAIIAREDPRHEQFYNNDQATVNAVNQAFSDAHPGDQEIGGGYDSRLEDMMAQSLQARPQEQGHQKLWNQPKSAADRSDGGAQQPATYGPEWEFTE